MTSITYIRNVDGPHEKLLLARTREMDWTEFDTAMEIMEAACQSYDESAVRAQLSELVPEYKRADIEEPITNVVHMDLAKR